jgi:predicted dehydrogenase
MTMKVCVVGGGSIGERHARVFSKLPGVETVCVVEPRPERVKELRERYPLFEFIPAFEAARPDDFQVCAVCVPATLHLRVAAAALERGMHALIEKPLTTSLEGVEAVARLAAQRRLTVGVAHVYRFIPELLRLREEVRAGAIGEVRHVSQLSGQHFPTVRPDYQKIYFARREMGGGVLLDFMCHSVDYFQWLCGRAVEVAATAERMVLEGIETEDLGEMLIRFESGARGLIHSNAFQRDYLMNTHVAGTKGTLRARLGTETRKVHTEGQFAWTLERCGTDGKFEELSCTAYERDHFYSLQAQDFLGAVRGEHPVRATLADGAAAVATCLAAHRSAAEKRTVAVPIS